MPDAKAETWRARLAEAARRDLATRARLAATGELFDGYNAEMEAVHRDNAALLEQAIAEIGWPGRSLVGDEGAAAAFLIVQHAIGLPDLQRRALTLILGAVERGDANVMDAALLADRIAVFEGRPQLYGTQFDWDEAGLMSPAPIAEPMRVDERRAEIGLPPLADAIAAMRAAAAAEGDKPPPDHAERRATFEAWARRVGWRA